MKLEYKLLTYDRIVSEIKISFSVIHLDTVNFYDKGVLNFI